MDASDRECYSTELVHLFFIPDVISSQCIDEAVASLGTCENESAINQESQRVVEYNDDFARQSICGSSAVMNVISK